jgi:hypothetical protein
MARSSWIFLLGIALAILVGCATVPSASPEADAAAKEFKPPEGKANLYLARGYSSLGSMAAFKLAVDGQALGKINQGRFWVIALGPGTHRIEASSSVNKTTLNFDAVAGRNYFYEVSATAGGPVVKVSLSLVLLEEMGKLMVRQGKLAAGPN